MVDQQSRDAAVPEGNDARAGASPVAGSEQLALGLDEYLEALRRDGAALASVVDGGDLDRPVPTCPGWTVRELAQHVGRVHRWATSYLRHALPTMLTAPESERVWGGMPDDAGLAQWLRAGSAQLVDALEQAPPDLACWSFLPAPSPLLFWARRQAHETAIHRADAQAADGEIARFPTSFAVDGLDELLLCFFSRPGNRLRTQSPRTLAVVATDAPATWVVHIGPDGAHAERGAADGGTHTQISGAAGELYCGLWNRVPWDALTVAGDTSIVDLWRERATVRWS